VDDPEQTSIKTDKLKDWLAKRTPLVAFSGGVDSTYLAYMAQTSSPRYLAVTVRSPLCPSWEAGEAVEIAGQLDLIHAMIDLDPLSDRRIVENPPDRCYHCKRLILTRLIEIAEVEGLDPVCEGTNVDDLKSYRPGRRAVGELGVHSPLAEVGLTKGEIRNLSRSVGLPTWDKEPMPCLATRVPYGENLDSERLSRIDSAEAHIRGMGLRVVRVRDHGDSAEIEIGEEELAELDLDGFRSRVFPRLGDLGYKSITISPYRSGRWDGKKPEPRGR
jgi:uncharacterized protein